MKAKMFLLLSLFAFTGCATTEMATPESDAAAKRFEPPPGKANLYISRDSGAVGSAMLFDIQIDEKTVGKLAPGTYILAVIDPGDRSVSAKSGLNASNVKLNAEAGKNYFYEIANTTSAFGAKPDMNRVLIEAMGKLMIQQSKRAKNESE